MTIRVTNGLLILLWITVLAFPFGCQDADQTTIQFFHMTWLPEMVKLVDEAVIHFEREHPGIRIEQTRVSWNDAPAQLLTSILGGVSPDISHANPNIAAQFRHMGAYADLTDVIPADLKASFLPAVLYVIETPEGRIDGYPTEGSTWVFFYRKDLFNEAGLTKIPRTWDELLAASAAMTRDADGDGAVDQWGLAFPLRSENAVNYWTPWMCQAGSPVVKFEDGQWISYLDSPEALHGTQFMVDLVQKNKVMSDTVVDMDSEDVTNGFIFGQFAIMINGAWTVDLLKKRAPELEGKWGTFLPPASSPGQRIVVKGHPNTFHVMEASRHKEEAIQFLNFFFTKGPTEAFTYADEFARIQKTISWTDLYVAYAKAHYDSLMIPFIEAVELIYPPVMSPKWQPFADLYGRSAVQDMIQGRAPVEETMRLLHQQLGELHAE